MNTSPGLFSPRLAAAALLMTVFLAGGCASKPHRLTRAPNPPTPSIGLDEMQRRQSVAVRTRELIDTGKYKSLDAARAAAERQYPPVHNSTDTAWSVEYAQWEKQKAEQEKFESAFAKSLRQP